MVAIKAILRRSSPRTASKSASLRQEYTVGRKVVHPRIIEIYAFGIERGNPLPGDGVVSGAEHETADSARDWSKIAT